MPAAAVLVPSPLGDAFRAGGEDNDHEYGPDRRRHQQQQQQQQHPRQQSSLPSASNALTSLPPHIPFTDLSIIPTVFPAPVANLISALATSARLSLRITAFFVEAILESSQYSTRLSLGYSRRLLISAISSARRMYLVSNAAFEGDLLGVMGMTDPPGAASSDKFLQVLDKYTNLGIYVIHHTFTMAELFAMSGFYLTANAVQSAHFAAQESVTLFDSLFGSNESSRALSSIITLVRRELLEDERFSSADKGKVTSLTALTKALTAFACLQTATWKRTSERLQMKTLYDCTVVAERDESYDARTTLTVHDNLHPQPNSKIPRQDDSRNSIANANADAGPGPSTMASRQHLSSTPTNSQSRHRAWSSLETSPTLSPTPRRDSVSMDLDDLWELEDLVGESGQDEYDGPPDETIRRQRRLKRMREDMLEITDELTESTIITHLLERVDPRDPRMVGSSRLRRAPLPDIAVEDLDESEGVISPATRSRSISASSLTSLGEGDENDWIEVDALLDNDRSEIPSVPNGSTSIGSTSYRDALEHPQANAERIQLVLKTMTNKLLQRRRTVRRVRAESVSDQSSPEGQAQSQASRQSTPTPGSSRPDVRRIEWTSGTPRSRTSLSIVETEAPPSSTSTSRASTPTGKRRMFGPQSPTPTNFGRRAAPKTTAPKVSSVNKAVSMARSAFSSRRSSRAPSPQRLSNRPTTPPPITGTLAPPPTPAAPKELLPTMRSDPSAASDSSDTPRPDRSRRRPSFTTVRESVRMSESRVHAASSHMMSGKSEDTPDKIFPHDDLVRNIHRFMRYSSAAYGQNFLRILGLGNADYNFPSTARHHANSWAFAQHTNIPIDSLLLSSYTEATPTFGAQKSPPLVHYIAVDHDLKAVILTCRGTLGLSDVLIDLTCEYRQIHIEGADPLAEYFVHSGMYQSAIGLTARQSTVHKTLVDALNRWPTYGLVVTGHSLGGGVAALLAILCSTPAEVFRRQNANANVNNGTKSFSHPPISTPFVTSAASGLPPGRPIHCYAYGPPAVASLDLTRYARGLITSVVQNSDVVPCLSLGVLRDLKNIAVTLFEEGNVAEEIVGRVVGIYQRKFAFQQGREPGLGPFDTSRTIAIQGAATGPPTDEEVLNDWMVSLIKTMRADMDNPKLYPPGMVYIMEYFDVFVTAEPEDRPRQGKTVTNKQAHRVILRQCDSVEERFREPLFSKTMLNDHLPSHYERSTQLLLDGSGQAGV